MDSFTDFEEVRQRADDYRGRLLSVLSDVGVDTSELARDEDRSVHVLEMLASRASLIPISTLRVELDPYVVELMRGARAFERKPMRGRASTRRTLLASPPSLREPWEVGEVGIVRILDIADPYREGDEDLVDTRNLVTLRIRLIDRRFNRSNKSIDHVFEVIQDADVERAPGAQREPANRAPPGAADPARSGTFTWRLSIQDHVLPNEYITSKTRDYFGASRVNQIPMYALIWSDEGRRPWYITDMSKILNGGHDVIVYLGQAPFQPQSKVRDVDEEEEEEVEGEEVEEVEEEEEVVYVSDESGGEEAVGVEHAESVFDSEQRVRLPTHPVFRAPAEERGGGGLGAVAGAQFGGSLGLLPLPVRKSRSARPRKEARAQTSQERGPPAIFDAATVQQRDKTVVDEQGKIKGFSRAVRDWVLRLFRLCQSRGMYKYEFHMMRGRAVVSDPARWDRDAPPDVFFRGNDPVIAVFLPYVTTLTTVKGPSGAEHLGISLARVERDAPPVRGNVDYNHGLKFVLSSNVAGKTSDVLTTRYATQQEPIPNGRNFMAYVFTHRHYPQGAIAIRIEDSFRRQLILEQRAGDTVSREWPQDVVNYDEAANMTARTLGIAHAAERRFARAATPQVESAGDDMHAAESREDKGARDERHQEQEQLEEQDLWGVVVTDDAKLEEEEEEQETAALVDEMYAEQEEEEAGRNANDDDEDDQESVPSRWARKRQRGAAGAEPAHSRARANDDVGHARNVRMAQRRSPGVGAGGVAEGEHFTRCVLVPLYNAVRRSELSGHGTRALASPETVRRVLTKLPEMACMVLTLSRFAAAEGDMQDSGVPVCNARESAKFEAVDLPGIHAGGFVIRSYDADPYFYLFVIRDADDDSSAPVLYVRLWKTVAPRTTKTQQQHSTCSDILSWAHEHVKPSLLRPSAAVTANVERYMSSFLSARVVHVRASCSAMRLPRDWCVVQRDDLGERDQA